MLRLKCDCCKKIFETEEDHVPAVFFGEYRYKEADDLIEERYDICDECSAFIRTAVRTNFGNMVDDED